MSKQCGNAGKRAKVYSVVPEEVSLSLQVLVRAAQRAKSPEETKSILEKNGRGL